MKLKVIKEAPKDLKAVTYHLRQGRKNMLLKQINKELTKEYLLW
jgi:hypothetical protein